MTHTCPIVADVVDLLFTSTSVGHRWWLLTSQKQDTSGRLVWSASVEPAVTTL